MRAYLARHGKAKTAMEDSGRGLSVEGTDELENLARFLSASRPSMFTILHSGKTRARETAEILGQSFATDALPEPISDLRPEADLEVMAEVLNRTSNDVLAVGHLPNIERLVSLLLTGNHDLSPIRFSPGTMVCLERSGAERWTLIWAITPELV
jgi:phosphohistidine phosphatase